MQGIDINKIRNKDVARAWNVLYALITDGLDEKKKKKLDSDIFKAPSGVEMRGRGDAVDQELQRQAALYLKSMNASSPAIES